MTPHPAVPGIGRDFAPWPPPKALRGKRPRRRYRAVLRAVAAAVVVITIITWRGTL